MSSLGRDSMMLMVPFTQGSASSTLGSTPAVASRLREGSRALQLAEESRLATLGGIQDIVIGRRVPLCGTVCVQPRVELALASATLGELDRWNIRVPSRDDMNWFGIPGLQFEQRTLPVREYFDSECSRSDLLMPRVSDPHQNLFAFGIKHNFFRVVGSVWKTVEVDRQSDHLVRLFQV